MLNEATQPESSNAVAGPVDPVVMHRDVKERVGIECASCESCAYLGSEDDGNYPEFAISWPVCHKFERYQYLKPFPFKTEQKCWEPNFWWSKFADIVDGSDESMNKALDAFVAARDA